MGPDEDHQHEKLDLNTPIVKFNAENFTGQLSEN